MSKDFSDTLLVMINMLDTTLSMRLHYILCMIAFCLDKFDLIYLILNLLISFFSFDKWIT